MVVGSVTEPPPSGSTIVPTPSGVKTSSSTLCATRPSMTVACGHAAADRPQAGLHLRDHPRLQGRQHAFQLGGADLGQERRPVGPVGVDTLDVGEDDELRGAERDGERRRGGVGVDVEDLAVVVGSDRGDDGDAAGLDEVEDGGRVDLDDVADEAEVDLLAVDDGAAALGAEQAGVLARQADRPAPRRR